MKENILKISKVNNVFSYISILFAIYLSGNYFVMKEYVVSVLVFLSFEIITICLYNKGKITYRSSWVIFLVISVLVFFFSMMTNFSFEDMSSFIAIILQIIGAMIICLTVSIKEFEKIYVNIILWLSIVSLILFFVSLIYPPFVKIFPSENSRDLNLTYYNAYVYVFWEETGWANRFISKRNSGIFWEPGVYQAFLNLALFFLLNDEKEKNKNLKVFIFLLTIISTLSATGYLVLFIIVIGHVLKQKKNNVTIFMLIGLAIILISANNFSIITIKLFNSDYLSRRASVDQIKYVFGSLKSYLFGYTFSGRNKITSTVWNSIFDSILVFGLPYVFLLLSRYYSFCKKNNKGLVLFIILIICFSVESLIWRPFFFLLIFYGMEKERSPILEEGKAYE